jgi:hypothetical protein
LTDIVSFDVYVWMSVIVLLLLFAGFRNLPVGEVLPNFFVDGLADVFLVGAREPAPRHVATTPTHHNPASPTPPSP